MKKIVLLVFALLAVSVNNSFSQVVKLEHGLAFSWMKGDHLENKLPTYSVMLGCDYFEHDWFYLSSEIGYIKKGGEDKVYDQVLVEGDKVRVGYADLSARFNYLHLNTSFRVKHTFNKVSVYAGIAPTLDFLMKEKSDTQFDDRKYSNDYHANKVVFGIKPELGAYYDVDSKLRLSLNLSYLRNISHIAKMDKVGNLNNNTLLMSLGIGYRL